MGFAYNSVCRRKSVKLFMVCLYYSAIDCLLLRSKSNNNKIYIFFFNILLKLTYRVGVQDITINYVLFKKKKKLK